MSEPPAGFPAGFEWDEAKNLAKVRKHGIDFRDAVRIFEKPTLNRVDDREDYGEVRTNSMGDIGGLLVANVTHTDRDGATRLISARRANLVERTAYLEFGVPVAADPKVRFTA